MRTRDIAVIGAPLDLGAGGRRGVDMGPSAIRYAGLGERVQALGHRCRDRGDVPAAIRETADPGDPRALYLDEATLTKNRHFDALAGTLYAMAAQVFEILPLLLERRAAAE